MKKLDEALRGAFATAVAPPRPQAHTRLAVRVLVGLAVMAVAFAALAASGTGATMSAGVEVSADVDAEVSATATSELLDPLEYSIRTRYAGSGGHCPASGQRVTTALVGVPTSVDLGGSALPDATVTLLVVPPVGDAPAVLELSVAKLRVGALYGLVEVVIAPSPGEAGRVAVGYDGCEDGVPVSFSATLTSGPDQLAVVADTQGASPSLTFIGSAFDLVDNDRVDATVLEVRTEPVPATLSTTVDIVGPDSYRATVRSSRASAVRIRYSDESGTSRTEASARIDMLPNVLNVAFSGDEVAYDTCETVGGSVSACQTIDRFDFEVARQAAGERTVELDAELVDLPPRARLARTSDTAVNFTTEGGPIGSTTVGFASFEPQVTLPTLPRPADQYLVADVGLDHSVAEVRVLGLEGFDVDAGDPLVVDVTHAAGPFHVLATMTTPSEPDPAVTRELTAHVLDLPATARVTFSPPCVPSDEPTAPPCAATAGEFTYHGSAVIGEITVDVTSSTPFVDDATAVRLLVRDVPTGLTGRLDAAGKTLTATLVDGALAVLEVQVHSPGDAVELPAGVQGVRLEDHVGTYAAFARITGLRAATVGWGATRVADVTHAPGVFVLDIDIDDTDEHAIEVDGRVANLPATARFEYTPGVPLPCGTPPCGTTPTSFAYRGSDVIGRIDFDVVSEAPLVDLATEAHLLATSIPPGLDLVIDSTGKTLRATAIDGSLGSLELELCSETVCIVPPPEDPNAPPVLEVPQPDGVFLQDRVDSYRVFARLSGLARVELGWGDVFVADLSHLAGPFDIEIIEDQLVDTLEHRDPDDGHIDASWELPVPIPHEVRTTARIRDLPAQGRVVYNPETQSVSYTGSAPIGSVEAWRNSDVVSETNPVVPDAGPFYGGYVVGRAPHAHVLVQGLPTALDLTFQFPEDGSDALVVDSHGQPVGRIELELLSDPGLLATPALAGEPILALGDDGLVFWDLTDHDADGFEPVEDPYAIVVRVTGLRSFSYATGGTDADGSRSISLDRSGGPDLWAEILRPTVDDWKHTALDGFTGTYRVDFLRLDYTGPPETLGVVLRKRLVESGNATVWELEYQGSTPGGGASFATNFGNMTSLDALVSPIPAGGSGDPGIWACIAPSSMHCNSEHNAPNAVTQKVSAQIHVNSPVHADVRLVSAPRYTVGVAIDLLDVELDITSELTVSKEVDDDGLSGAADTYVFVDSGGTPITVNLWTGVLGGDRNFSAHLPEGTIAIDRWVIMHKDLTISRPPGGFGTMTCPAGTLLEHDWGIDLQGLLCPPPRIDSVELADGSPAAIRQGETAEVHIRGGAFSPTTCSGTWPPCPGPTVVIGGAGLPNDDIHVLDVQWHSLNHVVVTVAVDADAPPDSTDVRVKNPVAHATVCLACFEVLPAAP